MAVLPTLAFSLLAVLPARADEPRRTHDITEDDYFTQADIFDSKIAPEGKHVVWVEGRWQKASNDGKSALWVVQTATGTARRDAPPAGCTKQLAEVEAGRSLAWARRGPRARRRRPCCRE
jgi:hypothetical protein